MMRKLSFCSEGGDSDIEEQMKRELLKKTQQARKVRELLEKTEQAQKAGYGIGSVIPAKRKSVKRMICDSIVDKCSKMMVWPSTPSDSSTLYSHPATLEMGTEGILSASQTK